jgi:hypothetical protein
VVVHAFEGDLGRVRLKVDPDVANPPSGAVFLINGMVAKDFEEEVQPAALFEEILTYLQGLALGETWLIGPGESAVSHIYYPAWVEWLTTHLELSQDAERVQVIAP